MFFECKKGIQKKPSVQQLMVTCCAIQHGVESEFAFTRMEPWDSKPLNQWMINCLHDWNWETRVPKLAQNGFVYFGLGFCGILYTWTIYVPFDLQVWCIHVLAEYTVHIYIYSLYNPSFHESLNANEQFGTCFPSWTWPLVSISDFILGILAIYTYQYH